MKLTQWSLAPKAKNRKSTENVTESLSRVFEKLVYNQLYEYLNKNRTKPDVAEHYCQRPKSMETVGTC